jgi:hypothetical protein
VIAIAATAAAAATGAQNRVRGKRLGQAQRRWRDAGSEAASVWLAMASSSLALAASVSASDGPGASLRKPRNSVSS